MNCRLCESGFDFTMIGGNSEKIIFEAITEYLNVADIAGCSATFSICRYDERYSDNAIVLQDVVLSGNTITVNFKPDDTIDLHGKYIWQLSIYRSELEELDELEKLANFQGNLIIIGNINKNYKSEV